MSDVGQAKLEDSNMANYGGEEMRNLRKDAAATDKELKGAGTKVGLEVWRVENRRTANDTPDFGIKRWPKEEYGNFFSGDSYIVLYTYHPKDPDTGKTNKQKLAWDVHFWLGEKTSIDERGVAAYKTVEIDDLLDDGPVQHREVQGNESPKFQGYFPSIQYMEGGIESGFRKVKPEEYQPRLIQVRRTKKTVRGIPCKTVSASEMNHGDVFILDAGRQVYLWVGDEANAFEKSKGANLMHNIVTSRNGKAKAVTKITDEFWKAIGGSASDVKSAKEGDRQPEPSMDPENVSVYKLSDASGKLESTTIVENGKATKDMLKTEDVFIIVSNIAVYAWVGEGATSKERKNAVLTAMKYVDEKGLPNTIPIHRRKESDTAPDSVFESMFAS